MEDDLPPELDEHGNESDSSKESTRELSKEQAELYGEELDAQDEAWVAKKRHGRKSDAHLSCPSCLCTLTIDCQRHATQESQWARHVCVQLQNRHQPGGACQGTVAG